MIGAQASNDQLEKILSYIDIGKSEGAKVITGGERAELGGDLSGGYYVAADDFHRPQQDAHLPGGDLRPGGRGHVVQRLRRRHHIANDTLYGLGAGVWSRDGNTAYRAGRDIKAGRVWTNCYHAVPGPRRVRRLQAVGHRPGEPQDDARPLPADQEPARLATATRPKASSEPTGRERELVFEKSPKCGTQAHFRERKLSLHLDVSGEFASFRVGEA